jgi:hypothetical protein
LKERKNTIIIIIIITTTHEAQEGIKIKNNKPHWVIYLQALKNTPTTKLKHLAPLLIREKEPHSP